MSGKKIIDGLNDAIDGKVARETTIHVKNGSPAASESPSEPDLSDPIANGIMGAARLVTHDHETAYRITSYAMETIGADLKQLRDQVEEASGLINDLLGLELGSGERAMAWLASRSNSSTVGAPK